MNLVRYYHTIKYLKIRQIFWRIFYRFKNTTISTNHTNFSQRHVSQNWVSAIDKKSVFIKESTVNILNKAQNIDLATCWNEPTYEKLWLYNLHYFDDLNAENAHERTDWHRGLIQRWIDENPIGKGNGWEPYPLSLRIVNWLKWVLNGNLLTATMQQSLVLQIRYLMKHIEWHLLGNHLLANAKALVFASLFFEGMEANRWYQKGMAIFTKQLPEQILIDGAHFELSPMYHSIILEDLLDLINLYRCYAQVVPTEWPIIIAKMFTWLQAMTHPDGKLSFFNDATFGIAPSLNELSDYADGLNIMVPAVIDNALQHLPASGYCRLQKDDAVLLADIAAVGPSYLPGHAHADTTSCEFSVKDQRILVNSGTSTYENNALRAKQRSTAAHNTLVIDEHNSSEVWGAFRVARRARVMNVSSHVNSDSLFLQASHNGYQRLSGKPRHTRSWLLKKNSLRIEDKISCAEQHTGKVHFHFHPSLSLVRIDARQCLIQRDHEVLVVFNANQDFLLGTGSFYPQFNQELANQHITILVDQSITVITEFNWI